MKSKFLVIGKRGKLARALDEVGTGMGLQMVCVGRSELDLTMPAVDLEAKLATLIQDHRPNGLINASAYTDVDGAEKNPQAAFELNAYGPSSLAKIARQFDLPLFHVSTDYVFSGEGDRAWTEEDSPAPLNAYGASKKAGEELILQHWEKSWILRTAWVFSEYGKGFMPWVTHQILKEAPLTMVMDQVGTPTYANHLAEILLHLAQGVVQGIEIEPGIYHAVPSGTVSRPDLVQFIADQLGLKVRMNLVPSSVVNEGRAMRPLNSRLDCTKLDQVLSGLNWKRPTWQEGVREFLPKLKPKTE